MQELVGRITALDPEASESLKVIGYFDALVEGHANSEVLLRGACMLTGCATGLVADQTVMRLDAKGVRDPAAVAPSAAAWPEHTIAGDWRAWIEREGPAHANDAMVLERLAIGLAISLERTHPAAIARRSLEVLIDSTEPKDARDAAAQRLRLDATLAVVIVALPATDKFELPIRNSVIATPVGRVRAVLTSPGELTQFVGRRGIGVATRPTDAPQSWSSALISLRLTSEADPVVDAAALGSMLLLARAADALTEPQPDIAAVDELSRRDSRALSQLEAIAHSESLRGAATRAGIHHSTMQARATEFSEALGFDVRTPAGRVRLVLALGLRRLATTRFDGA